MAPFAAVFNFLPFALVGVALARARGWAVVVRFVGLIVTAVVVFQISERALGPARTRSGSYAEGNNVLEHFGQMGSLVVAALLWTVVVPRVSRPIVALLQTNRGWFQAPD